MPSRYLLTLSLFIVSHPLVTAAEKSQRRLQHPTALAIADSRLFVAHRSGTIAVVDTEKRKVLREFSLGGQLADLTISPDHRWLLAVDSRQHQLILLEREQENLTVRQRLPVAHSPVSVKLSSDGSFGSVASLWSRRIQGFSFHPGRPRPLAVVHTIDLDFSPRKQWLSPNGKRLIVADAFGGKLAVVDPKRGKLTARRSLEGHNLGGLAASHDGRRLLMTHQVLNGRSYTQHEPVFWGEVINNFLRSTAMEDLTPTAADVELRETPLGRQQFLTLGQPSGGAGDPGEILTTSGGQTVICLSGVNEVALRRTPNAPPNRLAVGKRPIALAVDKKERFVYVANALEDSISVLDLQAGKIVDTLLLHAETPWTLADRGEQLFFDAKLSLDGWYSCHSCHTEGHANGLLNDNFGDDSFGSPKRILSLLGASETKPWAWSGKQDRLHSQILKSIRITMQNDNQRATEENAAALQAYLQHLQSPPSLAAARGTLDPQAIARGQAVFKREQCGDCHRPPLYTSPETYDVGLRDARGQTRFNPPSLRGASQRSAFFHDNRAKSLREVLTRFQHPGQTRLKPRELNDLLRFLESL